MSEQGRRDNGRWKKVCSRERTRVYTFFFFPFIPHFLSPFFNHFLSVALLLRSFFSSLGEKGKNKGRLSSTALLTLTLRFLMLSVPSSTLPFLPFYSLPPEIPFLSSLHIHPSGATFARENNGRKKKNTKLSELSTSYPLLHS